jgi:hypothetical protein
MGKRSRRRGVRPEDEQPTAEATPDAAADADSEPGDPPEPPPSGRPQGDLRLRDAIGYAEEADILLHLYRWTVETGEVPRPNDWLPHEDWPHPDTVQHVFGSWERLISGTGIRDAPLLARLRELEEERADVEARAKRMEREEQRAADQRRQLDVARRRREDAQRERDEAERRAARLEAELEAAAGRATAAEARLHERREEAERAAEAGSGEVGEEWLRAHEATLAELESVRAHREELLGRVEALEDAAETDRRTIARLSALLGETPEEADAGEEGEGSEEDPRTVLEAVRLARESCPNLVFTDNAEESAADSPYRRPAEILDALRRIDRLAERYNEGAFGTSLSQAAQELGLTWKSGISETARTRYGQHYVVTHAGHRLELGPHVALGSGSGAGLIARIYLHVADGGGELDRGFYVGHVGRHLPDTTT